MAREKIVMSLVEVIDHTPTVRELVLKYETPFQFKAGQFVMLHFLHEDKEIKRAYSIASSAVDETGLRLLFKYVENGLASQYVWSLTAPCQLEFTGPFGRVFFKEPAPKQVVFLNTGTGVSQHLSYLYTFGQTYQDTDFKMLFGVRNESEMYYQPQLEQLTKDLPHFSYEFVLSRPSEKWTGKKGYVQNFMSDFNYLDIPTHFYMCGNGGMIKEVKALLKEQGVPKEHIMSEAFH